ncbi:MAG: hypothetical protein H0Z34_09485, partial [Brevibacillus sp.]|nr:hypothetical protein [Brevibacillus sp.]
MPWEEGPVKAIATAANGNPDWVWNDGKKRSELKVYTVDGEDWVDFGGLVRLSGGGSPNEQKLNQNDPSHDGVNKPIYRTTWQTTPWPYHDSITFNSTPVVSNSTVVNNNYIVPANQPLNVSVTQTTTAIGRTHNTMKIYIDGVLYEDLSSTTSEYSLSGAFRHTFNFAISSQALLQPGRVYEITFEARDDYGRAKQIKVNYRAEGIQCDPATSGTTATLKPSGGSSQSVPSMGTYELPEGSDKVTLTFPQEGTLKVNGADFGGVSKTFTVPISGQTEIYFESTDGTDCWLKTIVPTVPDDECDPATSAMQMTLDIWGSDTDKRVTLDSSGTYGLERDVDTLQFWPGVKGTYYKNGSEVASGVSTYSFDVSVSEGSFTIKFVSEDGDCWEKRFGWESEEDTYSCPKVKWRLNDSDDDRGTIRDGDTIYLRPDDKIRLDADYTDEDGGKRGALVYWHIKTPSGQVRNYDEDPTSVFTYNEFFREMGTYEIWISFDDKSHQGKSWIEQGCSWKMFVVVEDSY